MPSYNQITYHIVFATKGRRPSIPMEFRRELYAYMHGILKQRDCQTLQIGGVQDHVHILTSLHPTLALADLVKDIKVGSGNWMRSQAAFPDFDFWQEGYGAFTHNRDERDRLVRYIQGQEEHHRTRTFLEELQDLVEQAGLAYDARFLP